MAPRTAPTHTTRTTRPTRTLRTLRTSWRRRGGATGDPTGLAGRDFRLLLGATLGTFANYAPLLSVAPLWAAQGGAGHGGVGAVTGVTMGTTVVVQMCMGWLLRRVPLRRMLVIGAVLMGLPTFGYPLSAGLGWVLGISAVRGLGFGMVTVAGSALVAELVQVSQRGRAVGWYGVAVGLPAVVFLPLGVWCAGRFGFTAVFVTVGALSLLAAPLVLAMSGDRVRDGEPEAPMAPARRYRALAGPWVLLITAACALGGVTSFLPLALDTPSAAPIALLVLATGVIVGRWVAGVYGDRRGAGRLLPVSVAACALGMTGFAVAADTPAVAMAAAAVYGLGFGALQNDTLVVMFHRSGPRGHGTASIAWNVAYDAGIGAGALAIGLLAQLLSLRGAFLLCALAIALSATVWTRRRGSTRKSVR